MDEPDDKNWIDMVKFLQIVKGLERIFRVQLDHDFAIVLKSLRVETRFFHKVRKSIRATLPGTYQFSKT